MKRIGILQIVQETCSFNPVASTLEEFHLFDRELEGGRTEAAWAHGEEVRGFLEGLREWPETEPVLLLLAQGFSGGPLARPARDWFLRAIRERIAGAGPLDGVLFSLHGAMAAADEPDLDGRFLEEARRSLPGPRVPIVGSLDLHAQLTRRMLRHSTALVAYHENPHLDRTRTGLRACRALRRIVEGARPEVSALRLPLIVPGEHTLTASENLKEIYRQVRAAEEDPEILSAALLMAQPYMDEPDLGWSILVVTDDAAPRGRQLCEKWADACWRQRAKLTATGEFYSAEKAVRKALQIAGKPVVIADGADATNSGAPGDSVHLLRELLRHPIPDGALTVMVDPAAVAHARERGAGGRFDFAVGGKRDCVFSSPLPLQGTVRFVRPARFVLSGHLGDNVPVDMGLSAAVRANDVTVLLVEKSGPGSTPLLYRCVSLEPQEHKIVVVKSPAGFRAEYGPFAAGIIQAACPGCANPLLGRLPYHRISRPLCPLDSVPEDWRGVFWCRSSFE